MRFLNPLSNDELVHIINTLSLTMLYHGDIKSDHIEENPALIDSLSLTLVELARHNSNLRNIKDLAVMKIQPEDLVRKVERNGTVLGVIQGGRG